MKKTTAILFFFFCCGLLPAQMPGRDELRHKLLSAPSDTAKMAALWELSDDYLADYLDSVKYFAEKGYNLARRNENTDWEAQFLFTLGKMYKQKGNYSKAIDYYLQAKKTWDKTNNRGGEANADLFIGEVYAYQGSCALSFDYYHKAKNIYREMGNDYGVASSLVKIASCFHRMEQPDSSLFYLEQIEALKSNRETIDRYLRGVILHMKGNIVARRGNDTAAMRYYRQSLPYLQRNADNRTISQMLLSMARLFRHQGRSDSALRYAWQSLHMAEKDGFSLEVMHAAEFLSDYHKNHNRIDSAFAYLQVSVANKDSLFSREKIMAIQNKIFADEELRQQLQAQQQRLQNNVKVAALLAALAVIVFIALILWRNNRREQKANVQLQHQKREVQNALSELKQVQQQLIHAEKMASLGELTAGIAHEIQNPLNFITNFSDIGTELATEAREEVAAGNTDEAIATLDSLQQSLQKINLHGNRADAIVKNMLQHSRKHTGERELADLNAIVDDCLRLSYQALKNKESSFMAVLKTRYDAGVGKVSLIPQDMGRVLLNLFNNSFYSVREKAKKLDNGFEPMVKVSTRKLQDKVEIRVWDNGTGIPEKALEKIYQPFFTTKPTGEGTGLGLSMSYDIVTKVHGGHMTVYTKDGEYAEFVIEVPVS